MGKKYRHPVNSLSMIDAPGLRLELRSEVESLLKKIDQLERERDSFSTQDQRLFKEWYDRTFRQEKNELETLHQEYISLAKFHNDIIAVTEIQRISPHEAYLYSKEEEKRYQVGSEEQRKKIDSLRKKRLEFSHKAIEEEFGVDFTEKKDPEGFNSILYNQLRSSSLEHLRDYFSGPESIGLAKEAMAMASLAGDPPLFIKIWDALPLKTRQAIPENFEASRGTAKEEEFIQIPPGRSFSLSEIEERDLKSVFRKIVRLIHPDSHDPQLSNKLKSWHSKVWHRVQEAYKTKNLRYLKLLEIMTMKRLEKLDNLSLEEIKASAEWLGEEYVELRSSLKHLEKHPAWKFSTKRNYEPLIKKIKMDFQVDLRPLHRDIQELKDVYNFYAQAAKKESLRALKSKTSKKRLKRIPKNPHSPQLSLFDQI